MKRLFDKDEIWFAVIWIVVYVVGFSNADMLSEAMGMPKLLTAAFGLALSLVLLAFVRKHALADYFGLCRMKSSGREVLYCLPLVVISGVNLWNGVQMNCGIAETVFYILSMCCVGFLEELIFRGFLFRGMCRSGVKTAVLISSLTFGMGHIVNIFLGEPLFETLLQLVYASAVGFAYTAFFYVSGSILPCILSHAVINSLSVFAVEPGESGQLVIALVQTALGLGYGAWLLRRKTAGKRQNE